MNELLITTLYAVVLGLFLGASYDVVRILRLLSGVTPCGDCARFDKLYRNGIKNTFNSVRKPFAAKSIVFATDVLYFVFFTVCFLLFLFAFNYGIFRWFILAFTVFGFVIYYFTAGKLVILFSRQITCFLAFVLNLTLYLVLVPFRSVFKLFCVLWRKTIYRLYTHVKNIIDRKAKSRYTDKCIDDIKNTVLFKEL